MAFATRKDVTLDDLEGKYKSITQLYDLAGELVDTVEAQGIDPEKQWALVSPLVNEMGEATDTLTEEFIHVGEGIRKSMPSKASKARIEGALRRLYAALSEYRNRARGAVGKAENIAEAVVQKIQRQVEQVVVAFLQFVNLSLSSVMNHAELSQLKAREARVALMMHHMAQQQ